MSVGAVYLVGAGCGPADLITLRGLRLLARCDAVVYDELIDPALLALAPVGAERIPMGKRAGRPSADQRSISDRLVALGLAGRTVVRLKGGDPFVFGRGGEELAALRAAGVPCEVVPGISSALAIPAEAGVPVTQRGMSRSLHVMTGHTAEGGLPEHLDALARTGGTLLFLMSLGRLGPLSEALLAEGMAPTTPAAVISGGNAPHPADVRGTLADIARKAEGVRPPAVFVVGETAALHLDSTVPRPLAGVRVGAAGTDRLARRLAAELEPLGARLLRPVRWALEPLPVDLDFLQQPQDRWVVFTSAAGAECFLQALDRLRLDLRRLHRCRFAVIGRATGQVLEARGIYPDLIPPQATTRALGEALLQQAVPGEELVLFRGENGTQALPARLTAPGRTVRTVTAYRLRPQAAAELPAMDYLVLGSAGAAELFRRTWGDIPPETVPICIGPVTAAALRAQYGDRGCLTAKEISVHGLAEAILAHKKEVSAQ